MMSTGRDHIAGFLWFLTENLGEEFVVNVGGKRACIYLKPNRDAMSSNRFTIGPLRACRYRCIRLEKNVKTNNHRTWVPENGDSEWELPDRKEWSRWAGAIKAKLVKSREEDEELVDV
jgi:hypothetical protein